MHFVGSSTTLQNFILKEAEFAQRWLDIVGDKAEKNNIRFESKVIKTTSSVPGEIVKYAKNKRSDLIIMGTKGRTGLKKILLGSVAQGVVTHARCPVTVIR